MISVVLQGGLGNQLFQIFAALALGIETDQMCVFTNAMELGRGQETVRKTYWDTPLFGRLITTDVARYPWTICREQSFRYGPLSVAAKHPVEGCGPVRATGHTMLLGYFQSPLYFDSHQAAIWRRLGGPLLGPKMKGTVSLHFRIGDYRKVEHVHPIMPVAYYVRAIECIRQTGSPMRGPLMHITTVRVFGEEADATEIDAKVAELRAAFPDLVFEQEPWSVPDWQQLLDMSRCQHHVIANSSFSWWGAYLNDDAAAAVVCYPDMWFGPSVGHDTTDLFPRHWTKISAAV